MISVEQPCGQNPLACTMVGRNPIYPVHSVMSIRVVLTCLPEADISLIFEQSGGAIRRIVVHKKKVLNSDTAVIFKKLGEHTHLIPHDAEDNELLVNWQKSNTSQVLAGVAHIFFYFGCQSVGSHPVAKISKLCSCHLPPLLQIWKFRLESPCWSAETANQDSGNLETHTTYANSPLRCEDPAELTYGDSLPDALVSMRSPAPSASECAPYCAGGTVHPA